jgi:glycerol-3-phosphate dehydrogenase
VRGGRTARTAGRRGAARRVHHRVADYAVHEEMARTVTDLLARRTGTFFWTPDGGAHAIEPIAEHLGGILGLTEEDRRRQVTAYLAWVRKNRPRPLDA